MNNEQAYQRARSQARARIREQLGELPFTGENVLEASIALIREWVYEEYYYAKPDVVEALLLQYRNFMGIMFKEIDASLEVTEDEQFYVEQIVTLYSLALKKTIEQLYSV